MKRAQVIDGAVFCGLVALAFSVRLISETPNFGAVAAATMFAGFYFRSRWTALCVPLLAMTTSDMFLGGYEKPVMLAVYGSLLVPIAFRSVLRNSLSPLTIGGGAIASSLSFYALSNGAVWYAWYPHTWNGLSKCYATALPFLVNSLKSDLLFSAGLFGAFALATWLATEPTTKSAAEAA